MKTIYTDKYALLSWTWAFLGLSAFVAGVNASGTWHSVWSFGASLVSFLLAAQAVARRRAASRAGQDPSIIRIVDKNAEN